MSKLHVFVCKSDLESVYTDDDFERDWEEGVPADEIAVRAGYSIAWVYQKRKRLDLDRRDPVQYRDPQG